MKNNFKFLQTVLLMCGVCGAGTDEVKTVSVMEGDSVTLNPDLTKIQGIIQMMWRFGDSRSVIALIEENDISYPIVPEMFKDRLKLDQTGSLTITNMKTKHSGLYKLEISHNSGTTRLSFRVTVYESPDVIDPFKGEMKNVSETEGESVTLQTDTETHGDELIVWRFGDEGKLIAKHDLEAKSLRLYDTDERFRDRLKLNNQTGSLTITNSRTTDSGVYKVKISSSKQTLYKRFTVTVSGVFGAETDEEKTVMEGDSVTLNPDLTKIQGINLMEWRFGDSRSVIAQIDGNDISYPTVPEMFKDRLKLDQTGSLTITNMRTKHSGLYKLEISHNSGTTRLSFRVTVYAVPVPDPDPGLSSAAVAGIVGGVLLAFSAAVVAGVFYYRHKVSELQKQMIISVKEGESFTLTSGIEINNNDQIQWLFGDEKTLIAEIQRGTGEITVPDERFRDRLEINKKTGSLTITNTRPDDTGVYELKIRGSRRVQNLCRRLVQNLNKRFIISVRDLQVNKSVLKGRSVTLNYDTEILKYDKIQWKFEEKLIAEMTGEHRENPQWTDEFRDQMKLNPRTGSLIIQQTRPEHSGLYKMEINSSYYSAFRLFDLIVFDEVKSVSVMKGEDVTLRVNPKIQTGDKIFWMFGDDSRLLAKNTEEKCEEESEYWDSRFKDKVYLNHQTGDLTIKKTETFHTGEYKLKIIRNGKASFKLFSVTVSGYQVNKSVLKGRSVTLNYDTEIQKDDQIQWKFGEKLIAKMTGENRENPQWTDEFRDQMKLNPQTGSLFIHQTRSEHAGLYKLEIKTSDYSTFRLFRIIVSDEEERKPEMKDSTEKRGNESVTVVMPLLKAEDRDGVNEQDSSF